MTRRWLLAAALAWVVALVLEVWLGGRLVASDVVAGLISPQGVTAGGLLLVAAFLGARLLAVLVLPGVVAAAAVAALLQVSARRR